MKVELWAAGFCVACITVPASAQQALPPAPSAQQASPPAPANPTVHMQDGFYASGGLGFGRFHDDFELTIPLFRNPKGTVDGFSGSAHLAIGGALKNGLILGGAVFIESVQDPVIEVEGQRVDDDIAVGTLIVVGPFIDWYFTPGEGAHLLGAIGGARITIKDESGQRSSVDEEPAGGAAIVGIGYNWWMDDDLSVGGLLRGGGGTLTAEGLTHNVGFGSINLVVTYN